MYCIKCGVELSSSQTLCPLCGTKVSHPDFHPEGSPTYPKTEFQSEEFNRKGIMFVITILFGLALILPVIFDFSLFGTITWSGYVSGGVMLTYIVAILPIWFKNANPGIFVPCDFAASALYLIYINLRTGGDWFLPLAFPVSIYFGLVITAIVTLDRYLLRGKLYIAGGGLIAIGVGCSLIEFCIYIAFGIVSTVHWSLYPLITLFTLGLMLIIIAIVKPLKESLKKFFYI